MRGKNKREREREECNVVNLHRKRTVNERNIAFSLIKIIEKKNRSFLTVKWHRSLQFCKKKKKNKPFCFYLLSVPSLLCRAAFNVWFLLNYLHVQSFLYQNPCIDLKRRKFVHLRRRNLSTKTMNDQTEVVSHSLRPIINQQLMRFFFFFFTIFFRGGNGKGKQ